MQNNNLCYVATPVAICDSDIEVWSYAFSASLEVRKLGFIPISPVLCFRGIYEEEIDREEILKSGLELLSQCSYIYDGRHGLCSKGVEKEIQFAIANQIGIVR